MESRKISPAGHEEESGICSLRRIQCSSAGLKMEGSTQGMRVTPSSWVRSPLTTKKWGTQLYNHKELNPSNYSSELEKQLFTPRVSRWKLNLANLSLVTSYLEKPVRLCQSSNAQNVNWYMGIVLGCQACGNLLCSNRKPVWVLP